jgi:hypothetical protein
MESILAALDYEIHCLWLDGGFLGAFVSYRFLQPEKDSEK